MESVPPKVGLAWAGSQQEGPPSRGDSAGVGVFVPPTSRPLSSTSSGQLMDDTLARGPACLPSRPAALFSPLRDSLTWRRHLRR
jgi:hypothetical protein